MYSSLSTTTPSTIWGKRGRNKDTREAEMELYQLDYVLHEPCEEQGWLYMAEIPELPGCRAWADTANEALTELSTQWPNSSFSLTRTGANPFLRG